MTPEATKRFQRRAVNDFVRTNGGLTDRESENDSSNNDEREIKRLAGLSLQEYERQRGKAAEKLGFRNSFLDRMGIYLTQVCGNSPYMFWSG